MAHTRVTAAALIILGWAAAGLTQEERADILPLVPVGQSRLFDYRYYGGPSGNPFALSPNGKYAVGTGNTNQLTAYDLTVARKPRMNQGQLQGRVLPTDTNNFYRPALAFTQDSKIVVGVSNNSYPNFNVHFWDMATGKEIRQIDNDQGFNSLAMSPDGKLLALGTNQRVEIWDTATTDEVRVLNGPQNTFYQVLAFSADGRMLAGAHNSAIQVWELATGRERFTIPLNNTPQVLINFGFAPQQNMGQTMALAFSADGAVLAAGGGDHSIRLWNLRTGRELPPLVGHQTQVTALVFTPDGRRLMSLDTNGLKLDWNARQVGRIGTGKLRPPSERDIADLWEGLAEADAFQTYRTARLLAAGSQQTLAFLQKHLQPVPPGNTEQINRLLGDLSNATGSVRRKAMTALRQQGEAALGALTQAAQNNPGFNNNVAMMLGKLHNLYNTPERQRTVKAVQVLEEIGTEEAKELLEKLAKGAAGANLTEAAKAALGRLKARAAALHSGGGEPTVLWNELTDLDAAKAFRAMVQLAVQADKAVASFRSHLKPVPQPEPKQIEELVTALGNNDFASRQKATTELQKLGEVAIPALKKALTGPIALEAQKRIEQLLSKLDSQNLSTYQLQQVRALEVLEQINSTEARQLLQELAQGQPQRA